MNVLDGVCRQGEAMEIPDKGLVAYATTQIESADNDSFTFRSLRRHDTERLADFVSRAQSEFGDSSLILFKHEGGHIAFKVKEGVYHPR